MRLLTDDLPRKIIFIQLNQQRIAPRGRHIERRAVLLSADKEIVQVFHRRLARTVFCVRDVVRRAV